MPVSKRFINTPSHKYLEVASGLEEMIHSQLLRIGDKLPSVRVLSEKHGISKGTAFQAYYHLESKGLIEARPKSGYYVRFDSNSLPKLPVGKSSLKEVSVKEMVANVFKHMGTTDTVNFSIALPPLHLLPTAKIKKSVVYALNSSAYNCLNYENVQGNMDLRKQISNLCFNWGGRIGADEIVVTGGCMEAIVMCLKAITVPGDTVAVESPTFFNIFQAIQSLGLSVVEIPTDPVSGVDLNKLEWSIKKFKIKACVFVPNFNNPLGSLMPDDKKKSLVKLITKYGVPLIEDDIYGDLYFGKSRPKNCKTFDTEDLVLECSSLSKSLAPGYRVGWCIPGRFIEKVKELKVVHTIASPTLNQVAMANFLSTGRYDYHLKNLRKNLHVQCLRYIQAIIEFFPKNIKLTRPAGGYVLWIELSKKINGYHLCQEAIKQNISISPGQIFSTRNQYKNYIRLGFGAPYDKKVEYGLQVLGEIIKRMSA